MSEFKVCSILGLYTSIRYSEFLPNTFNNICLIFAVAVLIPLNSRNDATTYKQWGGTKCLLDSCMSDGLAEGNKHSGLDLQIWPPLHAPSLTPGPFLRKFVKFQVSVSPVPITRTSNERSDFKKYNFYYKIFGTKARMFSACSGQRLKYILNLYRVQKTFWIFFYSTEC
jgi:hypothetical protein